MQWSLQGSLRLLHPSVLSARTSTIRTARARLEPWRAYAATTPRNFATMFSADRGVYKLGVPSGIRLLVAGALGFVIRGEAFIL